MATNCSAVPTVTNGNATSSGNDGSTAYATYACDSRYSLIGNSTVYCNLTVNVWDTLPSCSSGSGGSSTYNYYSYYYYYNNTDMDWFYYFVAALLALAVLSCLSSLLWCFCCCRMSPRYPYIEPAPTAFCCCRSNSTTPYSNKNKDSVFWPSNQNNKGDAASVTTENSTNYAQIFRSPRQAKELNGAMWMPHRNSIRSINTSTK